MKHCDIPKSQREWETEKKTVRLQDPRPTLATIAALQSRIQQFSEQEIVLDLGSVLMFEDLSLVALKRLRFSLQEQGRQLTLVGQSANVAAQLQLSGYEYPPREFSARVPVSFFTEVGEKTFNLINSWKQCMFFVGDVVSTAGGVLLRPSSLRCKETLSCMKSVGLDALPIVALISFLLGLIMAFMSAVQLRLFGANIYVASLVALSMARELAPIMTAIIVAGRSGSAFAAEIASMVLSEEVSALQTMGLNTTRFLVVPKLLATVSVMPLLVMFSNLFANCGGLIVGVYTLDLTPHSYLEQTLTVLNLFELTWSLSKSAVFATLIVFIGCFCGFQARGGAGAVGRATTSAVVASIFAIILVDSVLAVILRYWG